MAPREPNPGALSMGASARRCAAQILAAQTTLVLATAGEGGAAAAPLFYYPEGLTVYWLSAAHSQHSRNVAQEPRSAVAVYAPARDWRQIRGLQMRGVVDTVGDSAERARIMAGYRARFALGAEFDAVIAESVLYRFRPDWVRLVDNAEGFGAKWEWEP